MKEILRETKLISFASSSCFANGWLWWHGCQRALMDDRYHSTMVPHAHISHGVKNRPVGGCSLETQSHPIDMIIFIDVDLLQLKSTRTHIFELSFFAIYIPRLSWCSFILGKGYQEKIFTLLGTINCVLDKENHRRIKCIGLLIFISFIVVP
jgi:hypothetical protein